MKLVISKLNLKNHLCIPLLLLLLFLFLLDVLGGQVDLQRLLLLPHLLRVVNVLVPDLLDHFLRDGRGSPRVTSAEKVRIYFLTNIQIQPVS